MSPSVWDLPVDAPIAQVPNQVPGGTPEKAAESLQEQATKQAESNTAYYDELNRRNEMAASKLMQHRTALLAPTSDDDIFGMSPGGQVAGFGGGDIAMNSRNTQIKHGYKVEQNQDWNNKAAAIDSTGKDATFAIQELNNFRARGGQGVAGQADAKLPPGNLGLAQGILGNRTWDTRATMLTKLQTPLNDVFSSMRDAVDAKQYSLDQAANFFQPYGLSRGQVAEALKTRSAPSSWKPAGGAVDANRDGPVPGAASPLPGQGGDHGDQEGTKPPPRNPPGRLRPNIQAGFGGQSEGDVTNRTGMEDGGPNQLIPKMPKQVPAERQGQWARGVQILWQHPETAAEWEKRFSPNFPGTAKWVLSQRPKGFDQ